MRSTPTAAMEVFLNLTPLDLLIMAEARMAFYRLQITKQPCASEAETGLLSIWKKVVTPFLKFGRTTSFLFLITSEHLRSSVIGIIGGA
jgi:hypothetical protein